MLLSIPYSLIILNCIKLYYNIIYNFYTRDENIDSLFKRSITKILNIKIIKSGKKFFLYTIYNNKININNYFI